MDFVGKDSSIDKKGGCIYDSNISLQAKMVCKIAVLRFVVCMWNFGELY